MVLIGIDTPGRDHLPLYAYTRGTAPNLTGLASAGVTFDQAIAVHTDTAPSHASMTTGLHPARHVGLDDGFEVYADHLPGDGARVASDTVHAALPWMVERTREGQPFFLFVHLFGPHFPYAPPEDLARQFLPAGRSRFRTAVTIPRDPSPGIMSAAFGSCTRALDRFRAGTGADRIGPPPELAPEIVAGLRANSAWVDRSGRPARGGVGTGPGPKTGPRAR